ncbi:MULTISPECIES: sigma E protease regulator RseP [Gammaproteobacteria]|uniref:sigma E protease regulator RseP n=1 Tax=Gammaproteobacteria TaxID=1236 RepID=UPI000DCFF0EC|nr:MULTISPECIES: sigma E protease regulator RseP [Gammaproteobacteria]RTE87000.1 sigma E protease regulator RseP [Aliidiomarina sp. B3213]TCZ93210.1 sigma E protease regulator RseP [Lysobacter sp. N42]
MEQFIWSIGAFVVALGLVVTFHEFGHFWVARRCGVKILTFSIGFGKPLLSWKGKDQTQYQVAAIPLGGYVKMLDHEVHPTEQNELHQSFRNKPLWQRSAIVAAGPIANFIFSIAVLWVMLMIGMPAAKPIVGEVADGSIAQQAGIAPNSEIIRVDGHAVEDWQDVNLRLVARMGDDATTIETQQENGEISEHRLNLTQWSVDPETETTLSALGIDLFSPKVTTTLLWIEENAPAQIAGLEVGDKIVALNGTPVQEWGQITSFIAQHPDQVIDIGIERGGNSQELSVQLANRDGNGYLGVAPQSEPYPEEYRFVMKAGPIEALVGGVERTWQLMGLSLSMVKKLVLGDVGLNNISGPIGIAQGAGTHASYGLVYFLSFLALISVSLGILNLLPIPMLDGGHLLFYIVEGIQGKPVSERVQEYGFRIGLVLLALLTMVAVFNDINRLLP